MAYLHTENCWPWWQCSGKYTAAHRLCATFYFYIVYLYYYFIRRRRRSIVRAVLLLLLFFYSLFSHTYTHRHYCDIITWHAIGAAWEFQGSWKWRNCDGGGGSGDGRQWYISCFWMINFTHTCTSIFTVFISNFE